MRDYMLEGRQWVEEALPRSRTVAAFLRARLLHTAGDLARAQEDYDQAQVWVEECLELRRTLGNAWLLQSPQGRQRHLSTVRYEYPHPYPERCSAWTLPPS
jgi:hypothetical protein